MKIVLLRHGRTSLPPWPWITARELGGWIEAYDMAGIRDTPPPAAAADVAKRCNTLATSDLLRSVESAKALGTGRPIKSDGLFREAGLPYGSAAFIRLPPCVWAALFRFLWSFGFKANGESYHAFRKRAKSAVKFLISLAREHGFVLLVGHGLINRYIARELLNAGWNGPAKTKIRHWGFTEYTHKGECMCFTEIHNDIPATVVHRITGDITVEDAEKAAREAAEAFEAEILKNGRINVIINAQGLNFTSLIAHRTWRVELDRRYFALKEGINYVIMVLDDTPNARAEKEYMETERLRFFFDLNEAADWLRESVKRATLAG